jgi:hypothetical protein
MPILVRRGDMDAASALLRELDYMSTSDNEELRILYGVGAAEFFRSAGRPAEALAAANDMHEGIQRIGLPTPTVKRLLVQAIEAAFDLGDTERADELLGIVRSARPGLVTPYLRAHGARLAARLAASRGEDESVESGFLASQKGFREIAMPFDLALSLLEHAEWLAGQDRDAEAEPLAAEAKAIFERLRATPWIERASAIPGASALAQLSNLSDTSA